LNKIGIVGNNIKYSLSPKIHEFFARESRVAIDYQVIDCEAGEFAKAVNDFFKDSGAVGLNVTIPYKEEALNIASSTDIQAQECNSCNTLHKNGDSIKGYTTDGEGFFKSIEEHVDIKEKTILIVGAGGSARAVGATLQKRGANIYFTNRNKDSLGRLPNSLKNLDYHSEAIDVLVSCIPPSAADFIQTKIASKEIVLNTDPVFVDLSYINSIAHNQDFARHFALSIDGLGMLAYQAALSFKIWFGVEADPLGAISYIHNEKN
jgi:shikimate dehydrogenase